MVEEIMKLGSSIIGLFDDSDERKEKVALAVQKIQNEYNLLLEQIKANAAQASHRSIFVAGPRPAMMWICAVGFASEMIIRPWAMGIWPQLVVPSIPVEILWTFVPMFGIPAVSRSWEKNKGLTK